MSSVVATGLAGVNAGYDMLQRSAETIAKANLPEKQSGTTDLAEPLVTQLEGKNQVEASAKVIESANAALGSIIDIEV